MHNFPRLMREKARFTLLMHPEDAQQRDLENGQVVTVTSRTGRVEVALEVGEEMMQGGRGWIDLDS